MVLFCAYCKFVRRLQVLTMQDGSSILLILALGDPHVLERRERSQNGATDPRRVDARGRCRDPNLNILWRFLAHLGEQAVAKARKSVEPPERITCENSVLRRSRSDFIMACTRHSCTPRASEPMISGRNNTSGARNFSGPIYTKRYSVRIPTKSQTRLSTLLQNSR